MSTQLVRADLSASFALDLVHRIEPEALGSVEAVLSAMLDHVRMAGDLHRKSVVNAERIKLESIQHRTAYDDACVALARQERKRGLSIASLMRLCGKNKTETKQRAAHGRAVIQSRQSAPKKARILALVKQGLGPTAVARIVRANFGRCSASYVCNVVKDAQAKLPLRTLQSA